MPDAFHDSAARYPPPKCHPGTRKIYIDQIMDWALGKSEHKEPVLWIRGPFGVGKSAVAQSVAEALKPMNQLAATLFFALSNTDRDNPQRVFTSIIYQITTLCESFAHVIDARIRKDLSITTKSISTQFEELLVAPLKQIDTMKNGLEGRVVIIDGLDECRGTAVQCEIIRIITTSAQNRTTPFRWLITSRPEDAILRTMQSSALSSIHFAIELSVSRDIDHEILMFLIDEFTKVRESHGLPGPWPSDEALSLLVERGAGLWIYISAIVRFINDENSFGPEDQLRIVLGLTADMSNEVQPINPLAEMDCFYILTMKRIPPIFQTVARRMILLHSLDYLDLNGIALCLGLSLEQLRRCCTSIQSVAELRSLGLDSSELHFYHTSFIDFLYDPTRSRGFSVYGEFLIQYRRELLEWLHTVCSRTLNPSQFTFPASPVLPKFVDRGERYRCVLGTFWELCLVPNHPIDPQTATSISNLPFRKMLGLIPKTVLKWYIECDKLKHLDKNVGFCSLLNVLGAQRSDGVPT
ncbi:hypothetical protein NP233_g12829 [Leucocoprinus birnbaumii]|uniref:Nephrocystin 3-like N-terminal domain-containing protein n=1 Tax=Leucocoprinus birnbaumii TaxID=56174 RepID=A0AAD5VDQ1_9AGAR|nr:hypothetical protein NP233_g12829 [Leucocoprinus birnbaumii]